MYMHGWMVHEGMSVCILVFACMFDCNIIVALAYGILLQLLPRLMLLSLSAESHKNLLLCT